MRGEVHMALVGSTASAYLTCLTAVMTVVAGLPHYVCRCPNGDIKSYCLGVGCGGQTCCLPSVRQTDRRASLGSPVERTETAGCCCHHVEPSGEPPEGQSLGIGAGCCVRTPAPAAVFATARVQAVPDES